MLLYLTSFPASRLLVVCPVEHGLLISRPRILQAMLSGMSAAVAVIRKIPIKSKS